MRFDALDGVRPETDERKYLIYYRSQNGFHLNFFFSKFDLIKSDYYSIAELACLAFADRVYYDADMAWERENREDPKEGEIDT